MCKKMYRHGDLMLVEISEFPAKLKQLNTTILAEGEATGHLHQFTGKVKLYDVDEMTDSEVNARFVEILETSQLTHPEHKTLEIEQGKYKVIRENEFDYFTEEIRQVQD